VANEVSSGIFNSCCHRPRFAEPRPFAKTADARIGVNLHEYPVAFSGMDNDWLD
jgi:hypothetical protein